MSARDDRDAELGQLAYRAHNRVLRCETRVASWQELPPSVRTAWEVAAAAVRLSVRKNGR